MLVSSKARLLASVKRQHKQTPASMQVQKPFVDIDIRIEFLFSPKIK
jgi:hypothetical protein